jgi:hypothetical protein
MNIKESQILRFTDEMNSLTWFLSSLVFLDEVSFDNRSMLRSRGYGKKGVSLCVKGDNNRSKRTSLLGFIGVNGILKLYKTEGTFNRHTFFECLQQFAEESRYVYQYPGQYSIFIMDNARIHSHPGISIYLRSLGIIPIFLPPYCPFFNPIEALFHIFKCKLRARYDEYTGNYRGLDDIIAGVANDMRGLDLTRLYRHCGYMGTSFFNPGKAYTQKYQPSTEKI